MKNGESKNVMVYDLGGSTLVVTIINIEGNHISTRAIWGDYHLGGKDFDNLIANYYIKE